MRHILVLACSLLALLLLDQRWGGFQHEPDEDVGPDGGLDVLAFGRGPFKPAVAFSSGVEAVGDAILIGDRTLLSKTHPRGLRVAMLGAGLEYESWENFDISDSESDAQAFVDLCGARPVGSALVLAGFGRLQPREECSPDTRASLERAFAQIGSLRPPLHHPSCGWAMVTVRSKKGWTMLAESYSEESGVLVAYTLRGDFQAYEGRRGELAITEYEGLAKVSLAPDVSGGRVEGGTAKAIPFGMVGGVSRQSILFRPVPFDPESFCSLSWEDVSLGDAPVLRFGAGIRDGTRSDSSGAVFVVRVGGDEVARVPIVGQPLSDVWSEHEVDLQRYARQSIDLELRTYANGTRVTAMWGEPTLESTW